MEGWDPVAFKTLLRTTSQRLNQLLERKDSQGQLTRGDIATCLSQGNVALAHAKLATLIHEDMMSDLLEELEMLVGMVGSHVGELREGVVGLGLEEDIDGDEEGHVRTERDVRSRSGHMGKPPRLNPVLVEAAASIIRAAPSTESKDLHAVREILIQRLGPTFAQMASTSRNNLVSPHVMKILSTPPPTASKMDEHLVNIARTYNVKWAPEPRRGDLFNVISEILRVGDDSSPIVDLPRLREICARGLPDDPPWVRPRVWRLLLGTLPVLKTTWAKESQKQRDSYYDLVRRLLEPLSSLPSSTDPLSSFDTLLARISDSLFRVSPDLLALLGDEPKCTHSGQCPLDPNAPDTIRIPCASNLDRRLALLRGHSDACETPEIRLESSAALPPASSATTTFAARRQHQPTTLLPSKAYNTSPGHRAHFSALLRLLYLHSTLNPAVQSPHVPWLLVPLYSALVGGTEKDDAAHAEADTFWMFEALVGEIAEMEEEEGGKIWRQKLSERVKWADGELAASLHATGLDPILPHYSYRWLAPLLTQTLPLSSVFPVWDVLFACPMRSRDVNPKLECIVDICTALLVRARTPLFRLGKPGGHVPDIWTREHTALPPLSPLRPWQLSDAFTEGVALLTSYPIDAAGGIDWILQTASDLSHRRLEARDREKERERENVGFGARIKQQMWKGFTNQVADGSPEEDEEEEDEDEDEDEGDEDDEEDEGEHDDGNETETPAAPTLASRLANTVWRGITNQSSMDDEVPSPPSSSERDSPTPREGQEIKQLPRDIEGGGVPEMPPIGLDDPIPEEGLEIKKMPQDLAASTASLSTSLWDYAGRLKDSDTVAAFSKVSTNWRAKAFDVWRVRKGSNASPSIGLVVAGPSTPSSSASEVAPQQSGWPGLTGANEALTHRRGSLPGTQRESGNIILDPPRPAIFRSPRESFLPQPRRQYAMAPSSPVVRAVSPPPSDSSTGSGASSLVHRAGAALASLSAIQPSHSGSTPKSVPRPLLLNSRDLITTKSPQPQLHSSSRSEGNTPEYRADWGDVSLSSTTRRQLKHDSVSSTSSLSPSEAMNHTKSSHSRGGYARSRSDYESDGSTGRRVPLNRKSVSPMALASRSPRLPWNASPPGGRHSAGHPLSNENVTADVDTIEECGWKRFEQRVHSGGSTITLMTTGFDSPATIASPPIPRTPLSPTAPGPVPVWIVNGKGNGGGAEGHVETSSISTLGEAKGASAAPLEPPTQSRVVIRKKTPPQPFRSATIDNHGDVESGSDRAAPAYESGDSEMSMSLERTPSRMTSSMKLRSKRYVPRLGNLRLRPVAGTGTGTGFGVGIEVPMSEQRTPSPGRQNLAPEWPDECDLAMTPKVGTYRGGIEEDEEAPGMACVRPPVRKLSREMRLRKVSTGSREIRRMRDSDAEEGDDEGYDDLLSAYESEEGSRE